MAKKLEANRQNHYNFFRFVQLSAAGQSFQSPKKKRKLTGPCCRPHTCHQQDSYPVPVCIGVERWIAITIVVPDKGARNAKSDDRGKENKGEKKSMGETNNTFRRHSGFCGGGRGARELLNSRLEKRCIARVYILWLFYRTRQKQNIK